MNKGNQGRVVVSNGHGKFHMINSAIAAQREGILECFITAAYPTNTLKMLVKPLADISGSKALRRFLAREENLHAPKYVKTCMFSEIYYQHARLLPWHTQLPINALRSYQRKAAYHLRKCDSKVYHCRSGYGGESIEVARKKGMCVQIDHSIVHPRAQVQMQMSGSYDASPPSSSPLRLLELSTRGFRAGRQSPG